jgi:hypothetical protein
MCLLWVKCAPIIILLCKCLVYKNSNGKHRVLLKLRRNPLLFLLLVLTAGPSTAGISPGAANEDLGPKCLPNAI